MLMQRQDAIPQANRVDHARKRLLALLPILLFLGACGSGSGDFPPDFDDPGSSNPPQEIPIVDGVVQRVNVIEIDQAYAYRRGGRYASILAGCALIENFDDGCPLTTLPFISQETANPTVEDVMARVLVTHDWMGERFEALLRSRSNELLPLFGSVTSVVIGSTVRPSFYWIGTGGIQLDPSGLWLTVEEKASISIEEDFRAPFRSVLQFRNLFTIYANGRSIFGRYSLQDTQERSLADIEQPTMSLLFHELAHANDFLPPNATSLLNSELSSGEALIEIRDQWLSLKLYERLPLNSTLARGLARVRFEGIEPTDEQRQVSGDVVGADIAEDGAVQFYGYFTMQEDFATLFEAVQMKRLFDADLHLAFTSQPENPENFFCEDLLVEWGVLNRLGNPTVQLRASDVTQSIYGPDPSLDTFLANLAGTETPMDIGVNWCTNLDNPLSLASDLKSRSQTLKFEDTVPNDHQVHQARHAIVGPLRRNR
ncbi:MAG: hypothetical protein AB8B97_18570 [Granulosicoccus sp.]